MESTRNERNMIFNLVNIMLKIMNKYKSTLSIVFALIICIGVFFYWGNQKDIWFCDEVYTYESANSNYENNYTALHQTDHWVTGTDVSNILAADAFKLNFKSISDRLYLDHVPLYFYFFRIVSLICFGSCSKWIGLSINLIFYLIMFFMLNKTYGKICKNSITTILCVLIVLLHPITLSGLFTIRMYLMFLCLLLLFFDCATEKIVDNKKAAKLYIVTVIGLLTHYYFWVYICFFSIFFVLYLLIQKKFSIICKYIIIMFLSVISMSLIFPKWLSNIFSKGSKGDTSINKIFDLSSIKDECLAAFKESLSSITMGHGIWLILIFFTLILIVYAISRKSNYLFWIILLSTFCYITFVSHTQPTAEGRYLWVAQSILIAMLLYAAIEDILFLSNSFLKENNLLYSRIAIFILVGLILFITNNTNGRIAYLNLRPYTEKLLLVENAHIPWIVFYNNENWVFHCSLYDFIIPDQIKRVETNKTPYYDEILQNNNEVIVFIDEEQQTIGEVISFLVQSCHKNSSCYYEKMGTSYALTVYKCFWPK